LASLVVRDGAPVELVDDLGPFGIGLGVLQRLLEDRDPAHAVADLLRLAVVVLDAERAGVVVAAELVLRGDEALRLLVHTPECNLFVLGASAAQARDRQTTFGLGSRVLHLARAVARLARSARASNVLAGFRPLRMTTARGDDGREDPD